LLSLLRSLVRVVLLSFPTRRSSDLFFLGFLAGLRVNMGLCPVADFRFLRKGKGILLIEKLPQDALDLLIGKILIGRSEIAHQDRSEEHTSELQSRFDLVCRLLLEKN